MRSHRDVTSSKTREAGVGDEEVEMNNGRGWLQTSPTSLENLKRNDDVEKDELEPQNEILFPAQRLCISTSTWRHKAGVT